MTDNPQNEIDRIKSRIVALCDEALNRGSPYYLSRLGIDLGNDVKRLRLLTGEKLGEFIAQNFSKRYRLIPIDGQSSRMAVVRPDEGLVVGEEKRSELGPSPEPERRPRYHYRFWAAFSVPHTGGRRFLDRRTLFFKNVSADDPPPTGWSEIDEQFLISADAPDRDNLIETNIARWLEKNSLERSGFLASFKPQTPHSDRTLLAAMINTLDRRQLQNTTLSMDVVADLLNKRI
jgi:hypothetical protein